MSKESCVRCGEIDYDRRTLWMSCLYEMSESGLPFDVVVLNESKMRFSTLRVCKDCRASWLDAISNWFLSGYKTIEPPFGYAEEKLNMGDLCTVNPITGGLRRYGAKKEES